jgi:hypothetical protein
LLLIDIRGQRYNIRKIESFLVQSPVEFARLLLPSRLVPGPTIQDHDLNRETARVVLWRSFHDFIHDEDGIPCRHHRCELVSYCVSRRPAELLLRYERNADKITKRVPRAASTKNFQWTQSRAFLMGTAFASYDVPSDVPVSLTHHAPFPSFSRRSANRYLHLSV